MNKPTAALAIATISDDDIATVVTMWQRCELTRPWNDPAADIAFARKGPNSAVLVGRDGGNIVATVMVGHEGHRGWVYYVAVDPDHRGWGYGRVIMNAAEDWLRQAGIAKVQLLVRADNTKVQAFYESIDYDKQPRVIFAKWLDGREPTP